MEIDFNPGRVPKMEPSQTAARPSASAAADETSFPNTAALLDRLKNQSDIRPDVVARAKELISDSKYPPDDVLDRIAVLLAINVKE
jgi:hypothetical protein